MEMIATGQPAALVEIGLGRIVQASREWPELRLSVAVAVGAEHLLSAGVLLWLSIIVLRNVPVPRPSPMEMLVVASRQVRHFRIELALTGLEGLFAGGALVSAPHFLVILQRFPAGWFILAAGAVEFYGL
jgi:hypothetical protein